MQEANKFRVIHLILIAFFSAIIFFNLGRAEVQPWDEALYAVRAKSILKYDCWWDQTEYSLGGLYSSTYPPLSVWAIAISMKFFGENPFSIRLFSSLCAFFSVFFIYFISRRIFREENVLFAPLLLITALAWNFYSRQGMTDVPLTFFVLASFFAIIKIQETNKTGGIITWSLLFIVFFYSALMTKIVISLLPLLFVIIYLFLFIKEKKKCAFLVASSFISILLASIWYFYMIDKYGVEFSGALFPPHIYSAVEGNTSEFGLLYIFNQLLVSSPVFIFALFQLIFFKKTKNFFGYPLSYFIFLAIFLWFLLGFVVFSIAVTKLPHYIVYLIPPAVLLSILFYERIDDYIDIKRIRILIFWILLFCLIWSFSFDFRQAVKLLLTLNLPEIQYILFILLFAIVAILIFILPNSFIEKIRARVFITLWMVIVFSLYTRVILTNTYEESGYISGGEATAKYIKAVAGESFIYLYHNYADAEAFNPQLAWYLDDYMCSWRTKNYYPIALNARYFKISELKKLDSFNGAYLVYFIPKDIELAKPVIRYLTQNFKFLNVYGRYVIFNISKIKKSKEELVF